MGEVWLARDTRLGRTVAIKILPASLSGDPPRKARFEKEAHAIATLSHPHICQLYDVGSDEGIDYLVMEHLEGETLAQKLRAGKLPLAKAVRIGAEVASALDGAHRHQIVHRDVKPSNIVLTSGGARLIDFGLARDQPASTSSTTVSAITEEGAAPGTLAYMAPEQLAGHPADARSDIWGLGLVLYEMATGRAAFKGRSQPELVTAILTAEPDLEEIPHPALRHVIARSLARDPEDRWQSARDVAEHLRWIGEGESVGLPGRRFDRRALFAMAATLALLLAAAAWTLRRSTSRAPSASRLSIAYPSGSGLGGGDQPKLAISPDGTQIVFNVIEERSNLYSRRIDRYALTLLDAGNNPRFSQDGRWIVYIRGQSITKRPAGGGPPTDVGVWQESPRGLSWTRGGTIYFSELSTGILRFTEEHPGREPVTTLDVETGENSHRWPQALPDGKHVLFTIRTSDMASFDEARIAIVDVENGRRTTLIEGGSDPHYIPTGHIVFARDGALLAVPFDLKTLSVGKNPVVVLDDVFWDRSTGAAQYDIADEAGTLIYVPGGNREERTDVLIVDRNGVVTRTISIPKAITSLSASPDLRHIAFQAAQANDDIWTWDLEREVASRFSYEPGDDWGPLWTPDGRSIIYSSQRGVIRQAVDGSVPPEVIVPGRTTAAPSLSSDESVLAYAALNGRSDPDIMLLPLKGERKPRVFAGTPFPEFDPQLSPDGRWIAYVGIESGHPEVYLASLRGKGRIQVSAGGTAPRWSPDSRELFYQRDNEFFSVSITGDERPSTGKPQLMFRLNDAFKWYVFGDHFMTLQRTKLPDLASGINVVPHWFDEVRAKVPSP